MQENPTIIPNFLVIGAGKSGTTALYHHLAAHPDIYMSAVKETNFFALEGAEIVSPENDPEQRFHYPWSITEWSAYQALFEGVTTQKAVGEVSPMYLYNPVAPGNIQERLPDVKLVAILRQPADRLYSRYLHLAREGREPTENFEDAMDSQSIWWERNDLIREGFYFTYLKRYFELFDPSNIRVYLYEDLKNNPDKLLKNLYGFLQVDENFQPDLDAKPNVSGKIKNKHLDKLVGQNSLLKSGKAISPVLFEAVRNQKWLKKNIEQVRNKNLVRPGINPETRYQLTHQVYTREILQLQHLIDRDLTHWLS